MTDQLSNELLKRFDLLAEKLGIGADKIFPLVRQTGLY